MVAVQALEGRLGMIHKTFGVTREQDVSVIEGKCGSWTTSETGLSIEKVVDDCWLWHWPSRASLDWVWAEQDLGRFLYLRLP